MKSLESLGSFASFSSNAASHKQTTKTTRIQESSGTSSCTSRCSQVSRREFEVWADGTVTPRFVATLVGPWPQVSSQSVHHNPPQSAGVANHVQINNSKPASPNQTILETKFDELQTVFFFTKNLMFCESLVTDIYLRSEEISWKWSPFFLWVCAAHTSKPRRPN